MKYKVNQKVNHRIGENYLDSILTARGIESIERYLNPSYGEMLDPYELDNMKEACELYAKYIVTDEPIFLVVDCDNDGVTSAAMMYNYSKLINPNCNIKWMMHSGKQHGIELDRVPADTKFMIVPDAGSNQLEEHLKLAEMGIETLVLDHHLTDIDLSTSPAVIVNNQLGHYPNRSLSGAGVVYKFMEAFDSYCGVNYHEDFLDLAAVGIIGDMMDLTHYETRFIVSYGLSHIKNPGLKYFIQKQAFSIKDTEHITPTVVSFYITPLINAVIRVGTMDEKELLFRAFIDGENTEPSSKRGAKPGDTEITGEKAARVATNAKSRQQKAREKGLDLIEMKIEKEELDNNKILIVALDDFEAKQVDPNLTGLIAMQVSAKHKKPTIIVRETEDGSFKGSARGDSNSELSELKDFLHDSTYFDFAEGHECAFGCGIKPSNISKFIDFSNEKLQNVNLGDKIYNVDFEFSESQLKDLCVCVSELWDGNSFWGKGVEEPKVVAKDLHFTRSDITVMGKNQDSVKLAKGGISFVKFKDEKFIEDMDRYDAFTLTVVGTTQINEFMGYYNPQFIITDYNISNSKYEF